MARNRYIEEPTTPLDTFVTTSGFVFLFGGMFLGQWLLNNMVVGLFAGLTLFIVLFVYYVQKESIDNTLAE